MKKLCFLFVLMALIFSASQVFAADTYKVAVINNADEQYTCNLYELPSERVPVIKEVKDNHRFLIVSTWDKWSKVVLLDGTEGYIKNNRINVLREDAIGIITVDHPAGNCIFSDVSFCSCHVGHICHSRRVILLSINGNWCDILTECGTEGYIYPTRITNSYPY